MDSEFLMVIIPTILCGGVGSRLWPISREMYPKPFIKLADGQSLLQKTFIRGATLPHVQEILTVTNRDLFFVIQDNYKAINQASLFTSFILEPFVKNTAAAIVSAALYVRKKYDEKAIMLVLPADHLIEHQDSFQDAVDIAIELALQNQLVTFGSQPTYAETGYGYIEIAESLIENRRSHFLVKRFLEKPKQEDAERYLASGRYLWNSGIFCFTADHVLRQMGQFCPEILESTSTCLAQSSTENGEGHSHITLDAASFDKVPDNSFDYAVMEPASQRSSAEEETASNISVVHCDIGWSDIGSWGALKDIAEADESGNYIEGEALLYESRNCYIHSTHHLVTAVGVENLIVVDTPDALLIVDKHKTQDVKHLYAALKEKGHDTHKFHRTVFRPWGKYTVLEEGHQFKIKRIEVNPGASLSLQMHHHRNEHWIVVSGIARVINGDKDELINTNQSTYIPAGNQHRLENPGVLTLVLIEVQSGQYLGEDDIVRLEDKYGRV